MQKLTRKISFIASCNCGPSKAWVNLAEVTEPYVEADASIIGITLELRVIPGVKGLGPELLLVASR